MVNVYVFNIGSMCIHGKELLRKFTLHQKYRTTNWVDSSWKQLSLIGDEEGVSLAHAKVYVFSDSVLCLGKVHQNPQSSTFWEDKLTWFKSSPQYRTLDLIGVEPVEFEWNIFQGFTTLQLCNKVQEFMSKMSEKPE